MSDFNLKWFRCEVYTKSKKYVHYMKSVSNHSVKVYLMTKYGKWIAKKAEIQDLGVDPEMSSWSIRGVYNGQKVVLNEKFINKEHLDCEMYLRYQKQSELFTTMELKYGR